MLVTIEYQRNRVLTYANEWAYRRNPRYLDFAGLGGDCTNFASQCLFAGSGVMNYNKPYGWYYITSSDRTASWTSVHYFYEFLRKNQAEGPFAREAAITDLMPGDFIQLGDEDHQYYHTLVVTRIDGIPNPHNIYVTAHSNDAHFRALDTYTITNIRFLHVEGVRYWEK